MARDSGRNPQLRANGTGLLMGRWKVCVARQTGREFKLLGRNRIETQLERVWPIPAQETLAYAPPIADKECLFLRGERFLYCIGAD